MTASFADPSTNGTDETEDGTMTIEIVVVETMPEWYRGAHKAAGNWGAYPHNGAERSTVTRDEADEIVASDEDGYARIVRECSTGEIFATLDTSARETAVDNDVDTETAIRMHLDEINESARLLGLSRQIIEAWAEDRLSSCSAHGAK